MCINVMVRYNAFNLIAKFDLLMRPYFLIFVRGNGSLPIGSGFPTAVQRAQLGSSGDQLICPHSYQYDTPACGPMDTSVMNRTVAQAPDVYE